MTELLNRNVEKIVKYIRGGHVDEDGLARIQAALNRARGADIVAGDTVVLQKIRPRYLNGLEVVVAKVNRESYGLAPIPDDHRYGVWAGRGGVRVPKKCVALKER